MLLLLLIDDQTLLSSPDLRIVFWLVACSLKSDGSPDRGIEKDGSKRTRLIDRRDGNCQGTGETFCS